MKAPATDNQRQFIRSLIISEITRLERAAPMRDERDEVIRQAQITFWKKISIPATLSQEFASKAIEALKSNQFGQKVLDRVQDGSTSPWLGDDGSAWLREHTADVANVRMDNRWYLVTNPAGVGGEVL
jgi:hypothetical protein